MLRLRFPILTAVSALMAFLIILDSPARAETVAGWDFSSWTASGNNDWRPSPLSPITSDLNTTVVGLTRGWTPGSGTSAAYAWGGNNFAQSPNNTEAGALAAGNYAYFTITANPGFALSLSDIPAYNIRRSGTGPTTGIWQYELDSGSFTDIGSPITWGTVTTSAGNPQSAVDLSGIADLQNVAAGTPVTLRCVTWGATSTSGTWYFNEPTTHDVTPDIAVEGAINMVPEPTRPDSTCHGRPVPVALGAAEIKCWQGECVSDPASAPNYHKNANRSLNDGVCPAIIA